MRARHRPAYSKPWLGRHFILTETSFRWGRYIIADPSFPEFSNEDWGTVTGMLRELKPEVIATGFEELLLRFRPMCLKNYLEEISALYTYELARKNLEALRRVECEPSDYVAGASKRCGKIPRCPPNGIQRCVGNSWSRQSRRCALLADSARCAHCCHFHSGYNFVCGVHT